MEKKTREELVAQLDSHSQNVRLAAITALRAEGVHPEKRTVITNNHVHSTYSFSPYSPSRIVYEAYMRGLDTVGIMDHDSVGGAEEFIQAGKALGMTTTVGFEVRTDWSNTPFKDRRLNNPDQIGCAYMCVHGIPHQMIGRTAMFLKGVVSARNDRNRKMVEKINTLISDIALSFENDVVPLSMLNEGGSVTERHILFALANKMIEKYGKGEALVKYVEEVLSITLSDNQRGMLLDEGYEYYAYDLLNILKSSFVTQIYIPAAPPEIPNINDLVNFCREIGAVLGYAYLGNVSASPTGDKKAQVFEDAYLEELFDYLKALGIQAVAYMPSRNTLEQLLRVIALCEKHDFFQISGEDINQPRQSFICEALTKPEFLHLIDSTWALVGHELRASDEITFGMFAGAQTNMALKDKLPGYAAYGRKHRA